VSIYSAGTAFIGDAWDTDEDVVQGFNGMCIKTRDAVVIIDPIFYPPDQMAVGPTRSSFEHGLPLVAALPCFGIDPDEVTHVVVTHGHLDHCGGLVAPGAPDLASFPRAEHFFPSADWGLYVLDDSRGTGGALRTLLQPVEQNGSLHFTRGDVGVCEGVTLVQTPGESPGHQVVRIETSAGNAYYLGDLIHLPAECERVDWTPLAGRDADLLGASRRRIFTEAHGSPLVFTHARFPAWGRVEQLGGDAWRWTYDD
jgi:glyoxylase-like metal-dependent hydrolase (beta-lactamase superfamily II)